MEKIKKKRLTEKAQLSNNQNKMIIITIDALDTKRTLRKITFLVDKFLDFPFLEKNE